MLTIVNIEAGAETYDKYRGRLLYAEVVDENNKLTCAATLDFILRMFYHKQATVSNYKEALMRQLDFYDDMIRHVK